MGPLFSIGLVAVVGALIFCGGIIAGRAIGWSFTKSALVAIAFCLGGGVGALIAGMLAIMVVGVGAHLEGKTSVFAYLSFLGGGALLGGVISARLVAMRSNTSLERGRDG